MQDLKISFYKNLKDILKFIIFSSLLFAFVYLYLTDIVNKYQDEVTTITTKREPIKDPIWPAISFCMEKPFKPTVLKQELGIPNRHIFLNHHSRLKLNNSLKCILGIV